jgi:hypothetical protein
MVGGSDSGRRHSHPVPLVLSEAFICSVHDQVSRRGWGQFNHSVTDRILKSDKYSAKPNAYLVAKLFAKKSTERTPNLAKSSAVLRRKQTYSGAYGASLNRQVVGSIPTASTK